MNILRDPYTYITTGYIIIIDWVATHINIATSVLVGIGGLVTVIMGIYHRRKKNKLEIQRLEIDILIRQQELRRNK
jgi:hypothetical protein